MNKVPGAKTFDLEERTFEFASRVRRFVKMLPRTLANIEDARQLIKASGSVGANYIEANEALSKKDFHMRTKIARKEVKREPILASPSLRWRQFRHRVRTSSFDAGGDGVAAHF